MTDRSITTPPRLQIKNLTRVINGVEIVNNISLSIVPGQVTCLLGPSGCGKSTTLRLIAGVDRQDKGEIYIDGTLISGPSMHTPPENRSVGFMFQDFALFPHLRVWQNVAFPIQGPKHEKRKKAEELLDRVGLLAMMDKYPHA